MDLLYNMFRRMLDLAIEAALPGEETIKKHGSLFRLTKTIRRSRYYFLSETKICPKVKMTHNAISNHILAFKDIIPFSNGLRKRQLFARKGLLCSVC